jgi:large subunit ribosomal protein L9
MKIILSKDVSGLGSAGDIIKVKDGYARNYLVPKGFAFIANEKSIKDIEFKKRMIQKRIANEMTKAEALVKQLAETDVSITKKVGEEGRLFGSVTTKEIAKALEEKGLTVSHKNIIVESPIKKSGVYEVDVKVFREVKGKLKVWVVAEESEN